MKNVAPLDVRVLYTQGCSATPGTIDRIKSVAASKNIAISLQKILVESPEQAIELKFLGSPTVLVNGLDVDPAARKNSAYGFT